MSKFNIKNLKPNSHYKSGVINPGSCKKLYESQQNKPIIYRSSYEKSFILFLERNPKVVHWGSECIKIPYEINGEKHSYYPDFVVTMKDNDIELTYLIEVKPYNQTIRPQSANHNDYQWNTYKTNIYKWKAALQFCEQHNMKFKILTENTINKLKWL